jgi:predicted transcriptional regulator
MEPHMSTKEKKLEIIRKISSLEDELILEEVLRLVTSTDSPENYSPLSSEEITAIEMGLKDIEEGRVYTEKDARKIIEKNFF